MAGLKLLFYLSLFISSVYFICCSRVEDIFRVKDVVSESTRIENISQTDTDTTSNRTDTWSNLVHLAVNYDIAGGLVSIDCLRCLCLKQSNCLPIGCKMSHGSLGCGFFSMTHDFWLDCGKLGKDWRSCSNNLTCSSQCVQNYMKMYARKFNCFLNCEGYSRELAGGPNGCNNPHTIAFWEAVQKIPGCKGVE